jgi:hypothetical protein
VQKRVGQVVSQLRRQRTPADQKPVLDHADEEVDAELVVDPVADLPARQRRSSAIDSPCG